MGLELIGSLMAAAALGLLAWALRRRFAGLPKWSVPFAAACGLIGTTIWLEYDWFGRVSAELPDGVEVVWQARESMPLRPWTYLSPITTRFIAMDTRDILPHPQAPDLKLAKLYNFGRWLAVEDGLMVIDCAGSRQVLVTEGMVLQPDGTLSGAEWQTPGPDDGFQRAACKGG